MHTTLPARPHSPGRLLNDGRHPLLSDDCQQPNLRVSGPGAPGHRPPPDNFLGTRTGC